MNENIEKKRSISSTFPIYYNEWVCQGLSDLWKRGN